MSEDWMLLIFTALYSAMFYIPYVCFPSMGEKNISLIVSAIHGLAAGIINLIHIIDISLIFKNENDDIKLSPIATYAFSLAYMITDLSRLFKNSNALKPSMIFHHLLLIAAIMTTYLLVYKYDTDVRMIYAQGMLSEFVVPCMNRISYQKTTVSFGFKIMTAAMYFIVRPVNFTWLTYSLYQDYGWHLATFIMTAITILNYYWFGLILGLAHMEYKNTFDLNRQTGLDKKREQLERLAFYKISDGPDWSRLKKRTPKIE